MINKHMYMTVLALFCWVCGSGMAWADENKGPVDISLRSNIDAEKVPKPAFLPHQTHQWLECGGCHHGKDSAGKRIEYVAGQKMEKCEGCHNSKAGMPEKVATFKRAAHTLCMECHRKNDKELTKCGVCHKKE